MNARMEMFCLEYIKSGNATQSAINAGYSKRSARMQGQRLMTNDDIKARLQELSAEMESEKIAQGKELQETLTSIIRQQTKEEVIVVEGCGDGVSEAVTKTKKPNLKDVIKAVETLAKMQGLMTTNAQVTVAVPVFGGENDLEE